MSKYYTIEPTQETEGQSFSLWQPFNETNKKIQIESQLDSNWKYRQYMQKNANQIMKYNTMSSIQDSGNNPYTLLNTVVTNNNPYLYTSTHDNSKPLYGYRNSDLKQDYMKKEQMQSRLISPIIPTNPN